jgi:hypothetical protein
LAARVLGARGYPRHGPQIGDSKGAQAPCSLCQEIKKPLETLSFVPSKLLKMHHQIFAPTITLALKMKPKHEYENLSGAKHH